MNTISITELGERTREAQLTFGLRQDTVWHNYLNVIEPIIKRHIECGRNEFDYSIVSAFMHEQEKRLDTGEIKRHTFQNYRRGADRLTEMHEKGFLEITCPGRPSKFILNDYYEQIIVDFLAERKWHTNTREDVKWTARKFFFWLIQHGFEDYKCWRKRDSSLYCVLLRHDADFGSA